ncbi:MAG: VOC family protein [Firmicutes bacterium]|nr:VOC family protein [Bacillota bacterium]
MERYTAYIGEPSFDVAHLAHLELLTPKFEESIRFFVDVLGMTLTDLEGDSAYLRGWDDYAHHTLKLTAASKPALGHFAFRTTSRTALERRVALLERSGLGLGWTDGDRGHGPAYAFRLPGGHTGEILYEVEWYQPTPETRPALKNQASRFPGRGSNVRRLDHINILSADVREDRKFFQELLGLRLTEIIVFDDNSEKGAWVTPNIKGYEVAITEDQLRGHGRFHHVCYAVDTREEVLRAADICLEHGVFIETGPHKHAIQQTMFLYVYEPGGHRIEIGCPGARLVVAPDWQPIVWSQAERQKGQAWGLRTIASFHTYGTPPIEE